MNYNVEKHGFHHSQYSININNIYIDKKIISNKVSFGKKGLKYFIGYKGDEKGRHYVYCFQKCVDIQNVLIKLHTCLFW